MMMAALHKKYIRERATEKENPDDEFYVRNCFVCGEVAKPDQVKISAAAAAVAVASAAANGGADRRLTFASALRTLLIEHSKNLLWWPVL